MENLIDIFSKEKIISDASRHFLTEPEFVNLLCSPGIDPQSGGPVRQPYFTYRPTGYIDWRNRFLGNDSWASETNTDSGENCLIISQPIPIFTTALRSLYSTYNDFLFVFSGSAILLLKLLV
jgi:hypothetical protein